MTQGKISVANKAPGTEGQQQVNGEKKEPLAVPSAPPSYEEATSGEGLKAGVFPPGPTAVPLHPSWAYVDPSGNSGYDNGFPAGDHELFTTFSWDDQKVRRVFIRKVTASPQLSGTGDSVGAVLESPQLSPLPAKPSFSFSGDPCQQLLLGNDSQVSPQRPLPHLNTSSPLPPGCRGAPSPVALGSGALSFRLVLGLFQ
uniref:Uncharacterized protein n=1 Tax=Prolemur simus TaxID=1328070 RepID=A0A8C8YSX7_PROSS